jgi:hypothetical protein
LIGIVKEARSGPRPEALIDYMVFESHITTPDTIAAYRERFLQDLTRRPFTGIEFEELVKQILAARKADLPASQRHRIATSLARGEPVSLGAYLSRLPPGDALRTDIESLLPQPGRPAGFLDYQELYDWVLQEECGPYLSGKEAVTP